jgi:CRISPR/Cas system-associated exonuclease Cas4 (RecB family)
MQLMMEKNKTLVTVPVNEFANIMGYCEYRLLPLLEGKELPQTKAMKKGEEKHEREEEKEEELYEFKPITLEELKDIEAEIEFKRESVYTRLLKKQGNFLFLYHGRVDKMFTKHKTLFIEEDKFVKNPKKYDKMDVAFLGQRLQNVLYAISKFDLNGSFNPENWFSMPQKKRVCIIRIKPMNKQMDKKTGEYPDYKIFKVEIDENLKKILKDKMKRFQNLVLGKELPEHHNNFNKCKACKLDCEYKLK